MKRQRAFTISDFICPECTQSFPIPRRCGKARERGHVKTIWCPFCGHKTQMVEIRENDYYPKPLELTI